MPKQPKMTNKPYKCSKCEYCSNSKTNANKHIRTKKGCEGACLIENIVIVKCPICEKEFNDEISLKQHKNSCITKRAIVLEKYEDVGLVKQWSDDINLIINDFRKKFELLENENRELIKRIEKLEKCEKKKEETEEFICEYNDEKYMKKLNHATLLEFYLKLYNKPDTYCPSNFKLSGFKIPKSDESHDGFIAASRVTIEGKDYKFDDEKIKLIKFVTESEKCCNTSSSLKKGKRYCKDHS